jgi:phage-related holin
VNTNSYITMNDYFQMLSRPFVAMYDNVFLLIPSTLLAVSVTLLDTFYGLLQVEHRLVMGLCILMFIDLASGIYKAQVNGSATTSTGLRQTSIKFIEYTLVSFAFVILSNMADFLSFLSSIPFIYLSMIEIKSIIENLSDEKGVLRALFDTIQERINRNLDR